LLANAPTDANTINTTSKNKSSHTTATNASQSLTKSQAIATLTSATAFYANLLQQGQQTLGMTPYPNATAATAALNDSSSMASKWSKLNTQITSTDFFVPHVTTPYNQATTAYGNDTPTALSDWQNDMNDTDASLREWAQAATKWTDSEISNDQLATATQKVQQDIAKARADITALQKQ